MSAEPPPSSSTSTTMAERRTKRKRATLIVDSSTDDDEDNTSDSSTDSDASSRRPTTKRNKMTTTTQPPTRAQVRWQSLRQRICVTLDPKYIPSHLRWTTPWKTLLQSNELQICTLTQQPLSECPLVFVYNAEPRQCERFFAFDAFRLAEYFYTSGVFKNPLTRRFVRASAIRRLDQEIADYCSTHTPPSSDAPEHVRDRFAHYFDSVKNAWVVPRRTTFAAAGTYQRTSTLFQRCYHPAWRDFDAKIKQHEIEQQHYLDQVDEVIKRTIAARPRDFIYESLLPFLEEETKSSSSGEDEWVPTPRPAPRVVTPEALAIQLALAEYPTNMVCAAAVSTTTTPSASTSTAPLVNRQFTYGSIHLVQVLKLCTDLLTLFEAARRLDWEWTQDRFVKAVRARTTLWIAVARSSSSQQQHRFASILENIVDSMSVDVEYRATLRSPFASNLQAGHQRQQPVITIPATSTEMSVWIKTLNMARDCDEKAEAQRLENQYNWYNRIDSSQVDHVVPPIPPPPVRPNRMSFLAPFIIGGGRSSLPPLNSLAMVPLQRQVGGSGGVSSVVGTVEPTPRRSAHRPLHPPRRHPNPSIPSVPTMAPNVPCTPTHRATHDRRTNRHRVGGIVAGATTTSSGSSSLPSAPSSNSNRHVIVVDDDNIENQNTNIADDGACESSNVDIIINHQNMTAEDVFAFLRGC